MAHGANCVAVLSILIFLSCGIAKGEDRFLVEFEANGPGLPSCYLFVWSDEVRLHNTGSTSAVVKLVGLSNGGIFPGAPRAFSLAPDETSTLKAKAGWVPDRGMAQDPVPLWVTHLDVPPEVVIASFGALGTFGRPCSSLMPPVLNRTAYGRYPLPVYRALTEAGKPQFHLGAGFGSQNSHINVGIYNASTTPANAHIEVHQACDGSVIEMRDLEIGPDFLVQVSGFPEGRCGDAPALDVKVTVDQPSLSYVSTVARDFPTSMAVSATGSN